MQTALSFEMSVPHGVTMQKINTDSEKKGEN
jgi:hypothetical protein